ncbi:MAG: 1-acyl-sn-glycerol-3-phosphate acyltransferase [Ruminococcaceae bacterium]|nr:1-acyl-sn-glycerol-3-phosphate acyltransferase [Oscillospiraceae bacterium]
MNRTRKIYWKILRPLVIVFLFIKFGYTFNVAENLPDNYIVLSNHNTDFDPLFVGVSFKNSIRFVASEHISRWKYAFKFVNHIFAPIMRPKGTNAASTVKEMLRTLRSGDNVCMFAEGARSWNGITAPILPSTGKVVKSSKCALVTYKITGGYFVSPMWSKGGTRRGKIHGKVVNVYTAEQLATMTIDEINDVINCDLYEDAYATQAIKNIKYKGKRLAEQMESLIYCCPNCKAIDSLYSSGDTVFCKECKNSYIFDEYGNISGVEQKNVKDLFVFLRDKTLLDAKNKSTYSSHYAKMISVKNHVETVVSCGKLLVSQDYLICGDYKITLNDIMDMAMHGRHALVLSTKDTYYEILVAEDTSALKFYMLFQAYKYGCINKFRF